MKFTYEAQDKDAKPVGIFFSLETEAWTTKLTIGDRSTERSFTIILRKEDTLALRDMLNRCNAER